LRAAMTCLPCLRAQDFAPKPSPCSPLRPQLHAAATVGTRSDASMVRLVEHRSRAGPRSSSARGCWSYWVHLAPASTPIGAAPARVSPPVEVCRRGLIRKGARPR
jgi:hypothetical protein